MNYYDDYYYREPYACTRNDNEFITPFPAKCTIPDISISEKKSGDLMRSLLNLDSDPALDIASYTTTSMEPDAVELMAQNLPKNYSNLVLYEATSEIEEYTASMILDLFNGRIGCESFGVSTLGSEEAIYLAGINYKIQWQKANKECELQPEIIFGSNAHISWYKFAQYFKVKPIVIPVGEDLTIDVKKVAQYLRPNTIAVVGTLGDGFTGRIDDIRCLNEVVSEYNMKHKWNVPIHVDAANGGFILPFYEPYNQIKWDFSLECVRSINVSSHEFGFVYPGLGWALWKNRKEISPRLFQVDRYFGRVSVDISINYSRNASNISAQYFLFNRYGKQGYEKLDNYIYNVRDFIRDQIEKFEIDGKKIYKVLKGEPDMPFVAIEPTKYLRELGFKEQRLVKEIRRFGWSIGMNDLPEPYRDTRILRVMVNIGFSKGLAEKFLGDFNRVTKDMVKECFMERGESHER